MIRIFFLIAMSGLMALAQEIGPTISETTMEQDQQTQDVTVRYRFSGENPMYVMLDILTNGTSIGFSALRSLSGDVSYRVGGGLISAASGEEKTIVWKARQDWPNQLTQQARAQVQAYYPGKQPEIYLCVDLSGGSEATSWPVTYTNRVPKWNSPAFNVVSRTTQLWFRLLLPGSYTMGSPSNENWRSLVVGLDSYGSEIQHQVTLTKPFFMGVFEVTSAQYAMVMGLSANTSMTPKGSVSYNEIRGSSEGTGWPASSAVDATSFMGRLREKTGLPFDLPTQAEWEYACRAGTETAYYNGYNPNVPPKDATTGTIVPDTNLDPIGYYGGKGMPQAVGYLVPNKWGLYDMLGNVWELCLDWYSGSYVTTDAVIDPPGPATGIMRVRCGGACRSPNPATMRAASSMSYDTSASGDHVGFRISLRMN